MYATLTNGIYSWHLFLVEFMTQLTQLRFQFKLYLVSEQWAHFFPPKLGSVQLKSNPGLD